MPFGKEIDFMRRAVERSAALALRHQAAGVEAETKPDDSPVTAADKACEKLIAGFIEETFPDDGILGEEGASRESRSGRRWIVDPIDGTRDFLRGNLLWAVLIGLEDQGETVAGVVHLPMLGATYWASIGGGAYRNDTCIRVSAKARIEDSVLSLNSINRLDRAGVPADIMDFTRRFWAVRCLGGTPDAMMLASGQLDVWIEPKVAPWDLAAPKIIVEEAGAKFFSFAGERTIYEGNCAACTPALESEVRTFFRQEKG